jgi:hypothetical protein
MLPVSSPSLRGGGAAVDHPQHEFWLFPSAVPTEEDSDVFGRIWVCLRSWTLPRRSSRSSSAGACGAVRGWLRRFSRRAAELRALAAELAHRYDAEPGPIAPRGSPTADAVGALGRGRGSGGSPVRPRASALAGDLRDHRRAAALARSPARIVNRDHAAVGAIVTLSGANASVGDAVAGSRAPPPAEHLECRRMFKTSGAQHLSGDARLRETDDQHPHDGRGGIRRRAPGAVRGPMDVGRARHGARGVGLPGAHDHRPAQPALARCLSVAGPANHHS